MRRHLVWSTTSFILLALAGCDGIDPNTLDHEFRGGGLIDEAEPKEKLEPTPSLTPGCGTESHTDILLASKDAPPLLPVTACEDLPPISIDLLVVYEASLLDNRSHAEISAWIEAKVSQANGVFTASHVNVSYTLMDVRSVHAQVPSLEPGGSRASAIIDVWRPDPNHQLSVLRDGYGADAMVLIVEPYIDTHGSAMADICGIATLPEWHDNTLSLADSNGIPFTDQAFAVVEYRCGESEGVDDLTFAHELGHTLGLRHADAPPSGVESLFPFAHGYIDDGLYGFATLMACDYDQDGTPVEGVCNRISRLSDPDGVHLPNCKGLWCGRPTGVEMTNNRLALCSRASEHANFRAPSPDRPPQVMADHGPIHAVSGELVDLHATAIDDEDGDLGGSIEWIDENGQLLGVGPSLVNYRVYTPHRSFVGARVFDSAGGQNTAWLPLEVSWTPDPYEPQDQNDFGVQLAIDSHLVRTFDSHDDRDFVKIVNPPPDEPTIDIRVEGVGERAAPEFQVLECGNVGNTIGCSVVHEYDAGSHFSGQRLLDGGNYFKIEARAADGTSGLDTEYVVQATTLAPATVTPAVGGWYNPARSGHGIDLQRVTANDYVAIWFTYEPNGKPIWYTTDVGTMDGDTWRSILLQTRRENEQTTMTVVGDIALSFAGPSEAMLTWSLDGQGTGSEPLVHHMGQTGEANGMWYAPDDSGWGLSVWHDEQGLMLTASLYDSFGQPTWVQTVASAVLPSGHGWVFSDVYQVVDGVGLCPNCDGQPSPIAEFGLGIGSFELDGPNAETGEFALTVNYGSGIAGTWFESATPIGRLAPH